MGAGEERETPSSSPVPLLEDKREARRLVFVDSSLSRAQARVCVYLWLLSGVRGRRLRSICRAERASLGARPIISFSRSAAVLSRVILLPFFFRSFLSASQAIYGVQRSSMSGVQSERRRESRGSLSLDTSSRERAVIFPFLSLSSNTNRHGGRTIVVVSIGSILFRTADENVKDDTCVCCLD